MRNRQSREKSKQVSVSHSHELEEQVHTETVNESSGYLYQPYDSPTQKVIINGVITPINTEKQKASDKMLSENYRHSESSQKNQWESSVKSAYQIYKASGDWWNVFPKTDYTYSKFSSCRREIAPGVLPMPNMSRRSLHSFSEGGSYIHSSRSSLSDTSFACSKECSRGEFANIRQTSYSEEKKSITKRILISIWTYFSYIYRKVTFQNHYDVTDSRQIGYQEERSSFVKRLFEAFWFYLSYIYRKVTLQDHHLGTRSTPARFRRSLHIPWYQKLEVRFYQSACSFLLTDVWILSWFWKWLGKKDDQQKHSKMLLLLLIPLLLYGGFWLLGNSDGVLAPVPKSDILLDSVSSYIGKNTEEYDSKIKNSIDNGHDVDYIVQKVLSSPGIKDLLKFQGLMKKEKMEVQSILSNIQMEKNQLISDLQHKAKLLKEQYYQNLSIQFEDMKSQLEQLKMKLKLHDEHKQEMGSIYQSWRRHLRQLEHRIQLMQANQLTLSQQMPVCCKSTPSAFPKIDIDNYITQYLAEIFEFDKKGEAKTQENIRLWVKNLLAVKENLEGHLANITSNINFSIEEATEKSAQTIMASVVDQLRQEFQNQDSRSCDKCKQFENIYVSPVCENCSLTAEYIKSIVANALNTYDADKTGMVDYALETSGGTVINTRCTENYDSKSPAWTWFGINFPWSSNHPRIVIQPGIHPGKCWAFRGAQGYLVIALSARVKITAFSIEHIPRSLSPTGNIDSAPKGFSVWGLEQEHDKDPVLLGKYSYQENGTSLQFFPVQRINAPPYQLVELRIESNHGNVEYTCLYRFRVHGVLAND